MRWSTLATALLCLGTATQATEGVLNPALLSAEQLKIMWSDNPRAVTTVRDSLSKFYLLAISSSARVFLRNA
jgi:hypothetical protein